MVKGTVDREINESAPRYPMLMESTSSPGLIVLMTDSDTGTVVASYKDIYTMGMVKDTWCPDCFRPFHGRVILEGV